MKQRLVSVRLFFSLSDVKSFSFTKQYFQLIDARLVVLVYGLPKFYFSDSYIRISLHCLISTQFTKVHVV